MNSTNDLISRINRKRKWRRFFKKFWGILKWLLLFLILLFLFIYFAIQHPKVQEKLTNYATEYLSNGLNTTVKVDSVGFELFNKLVLDGVLIEDEAGDTLLYSRVLKTNLSSNLLDLIRGKVDLDELYLEDTQFNLRRDSGKYENNLQFILDYFSSESQDTTQKEPLDLDIDALFLKNVRFVKDDYVGGQKLVIDLPEGILKLNEVNLKENLVDIQTADLNGLLVDVLERKSLPLPPRPEEEIEQPPEEKIDSTKKAFVLKVDEFRLAEAKFNLTNIDRSPIKDTPDDIMDYDHLQVFDIKLDVDNFVFTEDKYSGEIISSSLRDGSGFVLNELAVEDVKVSSRRVELNGMNLVTPHSQLGDTLVLKYRTYRDFLKYNDNVIMTGRFNNAKVAVKDIMTFAPELRENTFFTKNEDEVFQIDGVVTGRVNKLRGRDLTIQLGKGTTFRGDFSSRDLANRNEELLNLNVDRFSSNIQTLKLLLPNFEPPKNFDKLGNLDFKGRFDGFFIDFVANGDLNTDLGRASMNMRLDLKKGRAEASYSGKLSLSDFDLGAWSGNNEIGKVTFNSQVEDGKGLTLETADAKLGATIEDFSFRGYTYRNLKIDGKINKNLFDGNFIIKDENIWFDFDGTVALVDSVPVFDFKADVKRLDLKSLNLTDKDFVLSGDIDFNFKDIDITKVKGSAKGYNLKAIQNGKEEYILDSLIILSKFDQYNRRKVQINSELLAAEINGQYDIQHLPEVIVQFVEKNYPEISNRFNIKAKNELLGVNAFDFKLELIDSKNFTQLFDLRLDTLRNILASGYFDNQQDSLDIDLEIEKIKYDNFLLNNIVLLGNAKKSKSKIDLGITHTTINGNQNFDPVYLLGYLDRDTLEFELNATSFTNVFDDLNLNGLLFFNDNFYQIRFLSSNLVILGDKWSIPRDNYIRFGKEYIETKNFEMLSKEKRILLESTGERGLTLGLENFDVDIINDYWDYERLDFDGKFNITAEVENIYGMEGLTAIAVVDTLLINNDDWGILRLDANLASLKDTMDAYLSITKGDVQLTAEGMYNQPASNITIYPSSYFDFDVSLTNYPLAIAEYFIGKDISETAGFIEGEVRFNGDPKNINIGGFARIFDGGIKVNYLNTRYEIPSDTVWIDNSIFDASGSRIYDKYGNVAEITGGITHDHLRDFGLNIYLDTDRFLGLDTDKEDNSLYYGHGIGSANVSFTGDFKLTNISIVAESGEGTELSIPVTYGSDASAVSFIRFKDKTKLGKENKEESTDVEGVNVNMNFLLNRDAEVSLIFDERAGDIIRGTGDGNLQIGVTSSGGLTMYGDYEIYQGSYLFTLSLINKPFNLVEGGLISWDGDPFGAKLDIEAQYADLSTSLSVFLAEYLEGTSEEIQSEARQATPVSLTMQIGGELLKPDINFEIEFPNISGELKTYADNKLRIIRQDQNELNRQVFGLLATKNFLPNSSSAISPSRQRNFVINTVSEWFTQQLSFYLSEILSEVFTDVGFISGIDFDVNYNAFETVDQNNIDETLIGNEIQARIKSYLWNNRLSVDVGGNIDIGGSSSGQSGVFTAGNLVIEYILTSDREYKIRFYQRTDQVIGAQRNKTGLGLSFRREFDTFNEFISGMKKTARKIAPNNLQ